MERTYQLFEDTMKEGRKAVEEGSLSINLPGACRATNNWWTGSPLPQEDRIVNDANYAIRSWMAVMTYLLSDYKFLYE